MGRSHFPMALRTLATVRRRIRLRCRRRLSAAAAAAAAATSSAEISQEAVMTPHLVEFPDSNGLSRVQDACPDRSSAAACDGLRACFMTRTVDGWYSSSRTR